jgi:hypothetical protein
MNFVILTLKTPRIYLSCCEHGKHVGLASNGNLAKHSEDTSQLHHCTSSAR